MATVRLFRAATVGRRSFPACRSIYRSGAGSHGARGASRSSSIVSEDTELYVSGVTDNVGYAGRYWTGMKDTAQTVFSRDAQDSQDESGSSCLSLLNVLEPCLIAVLNVPYILVWSWAYWRRTSGRRAIVPASGPPPAVYRTQ